MDKISYIIEQTKMVMGYPVLSAEVRDIDIFNSETNKPAIYLKRALLKYYNNVPYTVRKAVGFGGAGTQNINVKEMISDLAEKANLDENSVYYVGVTNIQADEGSSIEKYSQFYQEFSTETYFDQQYEATLRDMFVGDAHYEYDSIDETVRVIYGGVATIYLSIGFGFNSLDFVPVPHLDTVSKLTAMNAIIAVSSTRSAANIGELSLSADYVQSLYDKLEEEVKYELYDLQPVVLMWG